MLTTVAPWVALVAGLVGMILAALQIALHTVARAEVEEIATSANRPARARRAERVLDDPAGHARAVGLLKVLCDAVLVVALVVWVAGLRTVEPAGGSAMASVTAVDAAIGVAAAVLLLWLMSVLVPLALANHAAARLIYHRSFMLRAIYTLVTPLAAFGRGIDELVRRLVGAEVRDVEEQVQQDLLSVVEEGEQKGALDELERSMIEGVVRFGELTVSQIMTPRIDIEALEFTNNLGAVIQTIKAIGHSRIPVYEESLDHVVGVFYVKDLMKWLAGEGSRGAGQPFDLKSILRPALFVPESKTVRELLQEMIAKKVHIAMVADEYGGTAGLATIEDIVEQIVGDIKDEYEAGPVESREVVVRADQRRAEVEGTARIGDVNDALTPMGVEIPASDEYDTLGGFVITTLGRIPPKGERFEHGSAVFTVLDAKPTRVVKVAIELKPDPATVETRDRAGAEAPRA